MPRAIDLRPVATAYITSCAAAGWLLESNARQVDYTAVSICASDGLPTAV